MYAPVTRAIVAPVPHTIFGKKRFESLFWNASPFADRNDGCDGMITLSAAASELIGIIPSDGIQSMRI